MKQPEINKIKDGLHELGMMGKKGNQRSYVLQKFLGVYECLINTNVQRIVRKLSIKIFQDHSHLTFSECFCASRVVFLSEVRNPCCI